jgi:hypothetical protein
MSVSQSEYRLMEMRIKKLLAITDDAIALANEFDIQMWEGPGRRVMQPDLADLYRRRREI